MSIGKERGKAQTAAKAKRPDAWSSLEGSGVIFRLLRLDGRQRDGIDDIVDQRAA